MFTAISRKLATTLAPALLAGALALTGATAASAQNMAQTHMGHVTTGWGDTPGGKGLLPTAIAEAEIAVVHADLMVKQLDNVDWMKTHANHVLHAIDPSAIAGGPGLGYGVLAAAQGVVKHIGLAAAQDDASDNVKTHAVHVATSAGNTVDRVAQMKKLIRKINATTSAANAASAAQDLQAIAHQLLDGLDANHDGSVGWQQGEGGLNVAAKHMDIMRAGEGL